MPGDRTHTVIAIDPGPETSGLVVCRTDEAMGDRVSRVISANKAATIEDVRHAINKYSLDFKMGRALIAMERVSPGRSSWSLTRTSEVCGRILEMVYQHSPERTKQDFVMMTRAQVLRTLRVAGRASERDKLVRHTLIEMHGGDRMNAVGKKSDPGPLYGVASHAWAALAVAVAARIQRREDRELSLRTYND